MAENSLTTGQTGVYITASAQTAYRIDSTKLKTLEDVISVIEHLQARPIYAWERNFNKIEHLLTKL